MRRELFKHGQYLLMTLAALLALALAFSSVSCAAARPVLRTTVALPYADVYGAQVYFDVSAPAESRPFVLSRIEEGFRRAAAYWQSEPTDIKGWQVVVHGYWPMTAGFNAMWGITIWPLRRMDYAQQDPDCPELVLVHEWGHAASFATGHDGRPHGDGQDERFDDTRIRREALAGMVGCEVP